MRFLIHWILAFFIFLNPTIVLPALTDYDRQEFAFKNALADKNPGFESGSAGWTCSPSLVIDTDAADQIVPRSKGFATWNSTSAGQNCYSTAVKIPQSGNCAVGIWYEIPSGTGTHLIVANDGTNDLATESIVSSTLAQYQEVEFPCASSSTGNARIGIRSVAADEPLIAKDDAYIGRATGVRDVNINTEAIAFTPTGSWAGTTTYSGKTRRVGDFQYFQIRVVPGSAPTGSALTVTISSVCTIDTNKLASGTAEAVLPEADGSMLDNGSYFGLVKPMYSSTTAVQLRSSTSTTNTTLGQISPSAPITWTTGDTIDASFAVPCVGFAARTALDVADQGWFIDANIVGANPSLGVSNVSSYTEITNASLTMTPRSGSAPVGIMCSSTNAAATPSTGNTTCSAGSESIGATFNVPTTSIYKVCIYFGHFIAMANGESVNSTFQLIQTPTNAQTETAQGGTRITSAYTAGTAVSTGQEVTIPNSSCSNFNFNAGAVGVRLMYEQSVVGTPDSSLVVADQSAANGQRDIHITVEPVTAKAQAILTNAVVSRDAVNGQVTTINTVVSKTTTYTATANDESIFMSASGGAWTLSLPAAASVRGKKFHLVITAASGNAVTIDPNSTETVCGSSTVKMVGLDDTLTIQSDGTNWIGLDNTCYRHETASYAGGAGSCGALTEVGDWINTCSRSGTGWYSITFETGVFQTAPICEVVSGASSTTAGTHGSLVAIGATNLQVLVTNEGGTEVDNYFGFLCRGKR